MHEPKVEKKEEESRRRSENIYSESKVKIKEKITPRREKTSEKEEKPQKKFIPSPIISPVYGVLDKNYKKEDIVSMTSPEIPKKKIDVDMVRKKAFGTLEDDIEKTMNESMDTFYNEEAKSIDDLLSDSIDDTIEIKYHDEEEETRNDFANNIEEELDRVDENLEVSEEENTVEEQNQEEYLENNTLENDLFDLIDSMYDNREEE